MQFKELWSALRRRWYLVLLTLLVAVGGGIGAATMVGPTYETRGTVLVLPPGVTGSGSSEAVGNPYLSLAGVSQARDVVIRTLVSKTFHEELCERSGDGEFEAMKNAMCSESPPGVTFEATPDYTSSAPMILVTVKSKSPTLGGVALTAIVDGVPGILKDLQKDLGLRSKSLITSTPVVLDLQPDIVHKNQIRASLVVGAGLLALGVLGIALLDAARVRRRDASEGGDENPVNAGTSTLGTPTDEDHPVSDNGAGAPTAPGDDDPGAEASDGSTTQPPLDDGQDGDREGLSSPAGTRQ